MTAVLEVAAIIGAVIVVAVADRAIRHASSAPSRWPPSPAVVRVTHRWWKRQEARHRRFPV